MDVDVDCITAVIDHAASRIACMHKLKQRTPATLTHVTHAQLSSAVYVAM